MGARIAKSAVPLLDVRRNNGPLRDELLAAVASVLDSGQFIGGPACQALEKAIADICQAKFAVGCASGSDALLLALTALGIGPGDEVIVPSFTFFATASCVTRLGAVPVFADIDASTFNLDASQLPSLITGRTKAIIPVHLFGQCCDMDKINAFARENGLYVVEDSCQSLGAKYRGRPCGSLGDIGCFSFYPTKNLGGFGDGGMVTTNDPELAERIQLLANHGMRPRYYHQVIGINSRLDALQAAMLNVKIRYLDKYTNQRVANATRYHQQFKALGLEGRIGLPAFDCDGGHVWNQYTIRIFGGRRDFVRQALAEKGIGTEVYYPIPLHRQACFVEMGLGRTHLPETEKACREVLSLPIHPELTDAEQATVVAAIADIVERSDVFLRGAAA